MSSSSASDQHIFRFLVGTVSHGLFLQKHSLLHLHAYVDADWVGCYSTSGFCMFLGPNIISCRAKKQAIVARSNMEVEYRSVVDCIAEFTWLQQLHGELRVSLPHAPLVYYDNISATYVALNLILHALTKHIELDVHFVRECVASSTSSQRAYPALATCLCIAISQSSRLFRI